MQPIAGPSGVPYQILHAANGRDKADRQAAGDPDLAYLMELGYGQAQAVTALTEARGNVSKAFQLLFGQLTGECLTHAVLNERLSNNIVCNTFKEARGIL